MKVYSNLSEAYLGTLEDVYKNPDNICSPRGLRCREKLDYSFRVLNPVNKPIKTLDEERNKTIESYTKKEVDLYNSCTNDAYEFAKASKFWKKLQNPDGTVNSAYGYLIWANKSHGNIKFEKSGELRTPWEWAKNSLIKDKDTRQAIIRFSLPEHQWVGNKDQTCTMHANMVIRNDKLHLSVVMRSNDLMLGLVYDMPWFISLMDRMIEELQEFYPNLTKGHYTHTVHSMHIYERDVEKINKMLGKTLNENKLSNE